MYFLYSLSKRLLSVLLQAAYYRVFIDEHQWCFVLQAACQRSYAENIDDDSTAHLPQQSDNSQPADDSQLVDLETNEHNTSETDNISPVPVVIDGNDYQSATDMEQQQTLDLVETDRLLITVVGKYTIHSSECV